MQYFTERASSHREALDLVREKYGERAQVLSHRTVRSGGILGLFSRETVEVTGYLRSATRPAQAAAVQSAVPSQPRPAAASASPQAAPSQAAPSQSAAPRGFEEEKRLILEQARASQAASSAVPAGGGAAQPAPAGLDRVLAELREIRASVASRGERPEAAAHESLALADALLADNDFPEPWRRDALAWLRAEFTLGGLDDWREVQQRLLERIGDSIGVWREPQARGPRVLALVGPTGVGKTTTIAKLAAIYMVGIGGEKPRSVRMITIDNYRIGARQQIETYGDIMGVPVSCVETAEDLRKTIAFHEDADLILVDTIGKSPRDAVKLAEMQRLVAACGPRAEVHLALASTTKASDMAEILRQFEPFGYQAVVLTKLDETDRVGNAIAVLAERRKPLSYVTTGQRVPQDIERARASRLLMRLEGFRPDRGRLEARYGEAAPGTGTREAAAGSAAEAADAADTGGLAAGRS